MIIQSILWRDGDIIIVDQTKLPNKLVYKRLKKLDEVLEAIVNMRVRGAPLLGVIAALALALVAVKEKSDDLLLTLEEAGKKLLNTRPTAVNLEWGVKTIIEYARKNPNREEIVKKAVNLLYDDFYINKKIAEIGSKLIKDGDKVLTHCNTGSLATVSIGTALGVILEAIKEGKEFEIYITETRPKLQGSRLTAFELYLAGVDPILIVDSAVAFTIKEKRINKIFVGADRVLRDGTTFNKIGTLQIALAAKEYGADFYVVAPASTFDLNRTIEDVQIELRSEDEVRKIGRHYITIPNIKVYNPAFDLTPPKYITAFITEKGVIYPPFSKNILEIISRS